MGNGVAIRGRPEVEHVGSLSVVVKDQHILSFSGSIGIDTDVDDQILQFPSNIIDTARVTWLQRFLIRLLDLVGAILGLLLFCPVMLIVALSIKFDSRGRVFYCQKRVGEKGRIFTLYKFRTMVAHAETNWGFLPASEDDERITRVGKMLRKTRLDELPQLFNVIKGDMSLVGPRPENLYRVNLHQALRGPRLVVKPGITGLAQIRSLYDIKPDHKIKYDYLYIQRRSFLLNLYILIMTVPVVLKKTGW